MSRAKFVALTSGLILSIGLLGSAQPAVASAPSIYWHWQKMATKTKHCGRKAYSVMKTYVGKPTRRGADTVWARNSYANSTIQCIKLGKKKSLVVIIVTSNNASKAKRLRNYMKCEMASSKPIAYNSCGEG
jgi:hypothetical protein